MLQLVIFYILCGIIFNVCAALYAGDRLDIISHATGIILWPIFVILFGVAALVLFPIFIGYIIIYLIKNKFFIFRK